MHEDLLNAVSNLVHRHVLVTLHDMTGAMLARLDGETTTTPSGSASSAVSPLRSVSATCSASKEVELAIAARQFADDPQKLSDKPETVARRIRKHRQRARERQATNGGTGPETLKPAELPDAFRDAWPELREEFRAAVEARSLSRGQVAEQLRASKASVIYWLSPVGKRPSTANMMAIRRWLSSSAPTTETPAEPEKTPAGESLTAVDGPAFTLSPGERDLLGGFLNLSDARELRAEFGCTKELLERAAMGARLDAEIIAKLRGALANGAAE